MRIIGFTAVLIAAQGYAQTEIYNEDFQSGLPLSYLIVDNDGFMPASSVIEYTEAWVMVTDPDDSNDTIMGSTSYFTPSGQADRWMITPAITLGTYGNIAYWEAKSHDASFPDDYYVLVSTTDNQLSSFTDTLIHVNGELATWNSREANISDLGINDQTIYLAFVNRTDDGFKLYIDDIRVEMEHSSGLEQTEFVQFKVYPNPSSGIVQVSDIQDVKSIEIISFSGVRLLHSNTEIIDLSELASGRYIIVVRTKSGIGRTVVVKS